ncbi:hypothetical protein L6R49_18280, partial [Myxococcota bacterium]|nr:hypothetical protein [Myxococcota bacterium]
LLAAARAPSARISPEASADALTAAAYPGFARFTREYNGGAFPEDLADAIADAALERAQPVDLALARRNFSDGTTLWIAGIAHRPLLLDPLPRDLAPDELLPVRVEALSDLPPLTLFVAPPDGPVRVTPLSKDEALWVDGFHLPGETRLEVVADAGGDAQVLLLWSALVDTEVQPPEQLPLASAAPLDPIAAAESLYVALDALRAQAGLRPLTRFTAFEPLAREHAATLAARGQVAHVLPGQSPGVATLARARFHPQAKHLEDIAAAFTWQEAQDLVELSPGHRRNLLCETCTHASIGVALEPSLDAVPRLFVVWELLSFPNGEPTPIPDYDRSVP